MPSTSPSARSAVSGSRVPGAAGREHGIDQIRGMAVLLVVIAHVRSIPIGVGVDVNSELLVMFTKEFHTFRMPVLLVLSGLLFLLAIAAYLSAAAARGRRRRGWLAASLTCFVLAPVSEPPDADSGGEVAATIRRRALVAQLAEQRTLNPKVPGSIPGGGTRSRPG